MTTTVDTAFYPWSIRTTITPAQTPEEGEAVDIGYTLYKISETELETHLPDMLNIWKEVKARRIRTTSRKILAHYRRTLRTRKELWDNTINPFSFQLLAEHFCYCEGITGDDWREAGYTDAIGPFMSDDEIIKETEKFYRRTVEKFIREKLDAPEPADD